MATTDPVAFLVPVLQFMGAQSAGIGSPFYGRLLELMPEDVTAGGPTLDVLGPTIELPGEGYYPLRLLGALHLLVIGGSEASSKVASNPARRSATAALTTSRLLALGTTRKRASLAR